MERESEFEISGVEFGTRTVEPGPGQAIREIEEGERQSEAKTERFGSMTQVMLQDVPKDNEPDTLAIGEYEFDSEDVIYIFEPSKRMGIKFTSKSPKSALRLGIFETTPQSISTVEWDESINSKQTPTLMKLIGGEVTVMTYIVSEENFLRIINDIIRQKGKSRVVINVSMNELQNNNYSENIVNNNKLELEKFKNDLLNSVPRDNLYPNFEDKYADVKSTLNDDIEESEKIGNGPLNDLPSNDDYSSIDDNDKYSGFWDEHNDINKIRL